MSIDFAAETCKAENVMDEATFQRSVLVLGYNKAADVINIPEKFKQLH